MTACSTTSLLQSRPKNDESRNSSRHVVLLMQSRCLLCIARFLPKQRETMLWLKDQLSCCHLPFCCASAEASSHTMMLPNFDSCGALQRVAIVMPGCCKSRVADRARDEKCVAAMLSSCSALAASSCFEGVAASKACAVGKRSLQEDYRLS